MCSAIVVGNGHIPYPQGKQIDSFDTVIRCSGFVTEGFEDLVGTKTDIWITSYPNKARDVQRTWSGHPQGLATLPTKECKQIYKNFEPCNVDVVVKVYGDLGFFSKNMHPTIGMFAIYRAMEEFGNITITGFDFSDPTHPEYYWSDEYQEKSQVSYKGHGYIFEREVVGHWVRKGRIHVLKWGDK